MCDKPATKMLIDGDGPDQYTLSCDEHEEALKSDTHIETVPYDARDWPNSPPAMCCYVEGRAATDDVKRRLYQRYSRSELTGDDRWQQMMMHEGTAYIVRVEEDGRRSIWRSVPPQIFRFVASVATDAEGRKVVAEDFEAMTGPVPEGEQ